VLAKPERFWLLVEEGDETLDYRDAVRRYAGARQTVLPGGDHSFTRWNDYLDAIIDFAGVSHGPPCTPENTRHRHPRRHQRLRDLGPGADLLQADRRGPAVEIIAHRVVWAMLLMTALIGFGRGFGDALRIARQPAQLARIALASALVITTG
jgi:hypothetical protein